ncbi:phosphotransferase (plasmid) [Pseudoalteromonas sp. T1lg65]|uniref:phosphotransferase n=1 Tax=Pseudoalteromonas sp. T1lg65 TaxID=2077101 RepID=UPI003F79CE7E
MARLVKRLAQADLATQSVNLWSGCGEVTFIKFEQQHLALKRARVPSQLQHARIAQSEIALRRKVRSYENERSFYHYYASSLPNECNVPQYLDSAIEGNTSYLLLTDFQQMEYRQEKVVNDKQILWVLNWLAEFHAHFLLQPTTKVNKQGNYWHLDTRPDEWQRMPNTRLKQQAHILDQALKCCKWQTWLHGDAKLANFAFNSKQALGFDFQYVGGGIGVCDVMLFFTSVFSGEQLELQANEYLEHYFAELSQAMSHKLTSHEIDELTSSWLALWPTVWADFHRFLVGWKPDHVKINAYMQAHTDAVLREI